MVVIKKYTLSLTAFISLIALALIGGLLFNNEKYMLFAIIAAVITCIPFFAIFENKKNSSREIVLMGVMIALCIAGRFIFTLIPHFKPVTALVIITGLYFGCNAGFVTGSLSALLSNMHHGQGPWTVFQMAVWGLIGLTAGILGKNNFLKKKKAVLWIFSAIAGIAYSLVMDVYTTISVDSTFSLGRYIMYVGYSLPVMVEYIISNIVFIAVLEKPIGKKLERLKTKYGVFMQ